MPTMSLTLHRVVLLCATTSVTPLTRLGIFDAKAGIKLSSDRALHHASANVSHMEIAPRGIGERSGDTDLQTEAAPTNTAAKPDSGGGTSALDRQHLNFASGMQNHFVSSVTTSHDPEGAVIWRTNESYPSVIIRHPDGVSSHRNGGLVKWANVNFLSLEKILLFTFVGYPVFLLCFLMVMVLLVSLSLRTDPEKEFELSGVAPSRFSDMILGQLTARSKVLYASWHFFCRFIPGIMVFGMPVILIIVSHAYPQEVYVVLSLLTSAMMFANGLWMVVFGGTAIARIPRTETLDYEDQRLEALRQNAHLRENSDVTHWVIIPQCNEQVSIVAQTLKSVAQSSLAPSHISVVLAMEAREVESRTKANELKQRFAGAFKEILVTYHPKDLPNDPPGKGSNVCWAFQKLSEHLSAAVSRRDGILITTADADSEFDVHYFNALSNAYLSGGSENEYKIYQAPVFHLKNYHRQPMPIGVGTMMTCMTELAALSDPNAVRFPYSTYSLPLTLAELVGGWDPDWIAEDWHMGLKCFLISMGRTTVEPILTPTLNYTPEDNTWFTTILARWAQAKRHSLGFSDLSYYFMMLPLLHTSAVSNKSTGMNHDYKSFWGTIVNGMMLVIKLVNVHVVIGVLCTYMVLGCTLQLIMRVMLQDRNVSNLFGRPQPCTQLLGLSGGICMLGVTILFTRTYEILKHRIEGRPWNHSIPHFIYTLLAAFLFGIFYFIMLGLASWKAAVNCMFSHHFEYEIAAKPILKETPGNAAEKH